MPLAFERRSGVDRCARQRIGPARRQSSCVMTVLPSINVGTRQSFDYSVLEAPAAEEARVAADRIRDRVKSSIIDIGRELMKVKACLDHGQFGQWLKAEFGWTDRTARNYMSAADLANSKSETVSVLPANALYRLASPGTPEDVQNEIVARLEKGEKLSVDQVEAAISEARRQREQPRFGPQETEITLFESKADDAARRAIALLKSRLGDDLAGR